MHKRRLGFFIFFVVVLVVMIITLKPETTENEQVFQENNSFNNDLSLSAEHFIKLTPEASPDELSAPSFVIASEDEGPTPTPRPSNISIQDGVRFYGGVRIK